MGLRAVVINSDDILRVFVETAASDQRNHARSGDALRHIHLRLLRIVAVIIGGEDAVHRTCLQSFAHLMRIGEHDRLKLQRGIVQAVLRDIEKVAQRADQLSAGIIPIAIGQIIVQIAHADSSVILQPVQIIRRKAFACVGIEIVPIQALIVIPVSGQQQMHGCVQLGLEIRSGGADCEVEI